MTTRKMLPPWYRKMLRYARKHIKNFLIKTACWVCGIGLLAGVCLVDSFTSWQPYVIMAAQAAFLLLAGYANGVFGGEGD